jgi:hypothetical protein
MPPAGEENLRPGDVAEIGAGQLERHAGRFVGAAHAAHRDARGQRLVFGPIIAVSISPSPGTSVSWFDGNWDLLPEHCAKLSIPAPETRSEVRIEAAWPLALRWR